MSLSVSFRVVEMRAHESMEHTVTVMEQRRPLLREAQPGPQLGGPLNVGRAFVGDALQAQAQQAPPVIITVPVTPEQFAQCRIGMNFELALPQTTATEAPAAPYLHGSRG